VGDVHNTIGSSYIIHYYIIAAGENLIKNIVKSFAVVSKGSIFVAYKANIVLNLIKKLNICQKKLLILKVLV
jgi:hypothetical protein